MVRSATRAYVILARKAQVGVIFRRGPSKQVLLIKWDLERDTFAFGQWLRGRIYERRCDLSPQGDLLYISQPIGPSRHPSATTPAL
jgi:hypothetical protein